MRSILISEQNVKKSINPCGCIMTVNQVISNKSVTINQVAGRYFRQLNSCHGNFKLTFCVVSPRLVVGRYKTWTPPPDLDLIWTPFGLLLDPLQDLFWKPFGPPWTPSEPPSGPPFGPTSGPPFYSENVIFSVKEGH